MVVDQLERVGTACGALLAVGGFAGAVARTRFGRWIGRGFAGAIRHGLVGAFEDALAHELAPLARGTVALDRRVDHLEVIARDTAQFAEAIADDLGHLRGQLDEPAPAIIPPRQRKKSP